MKPEDYGIRKYTWNNGLLDCHQKYRDLYKKVNCVDNKDKKTTIKNLKKKIFISNLVLGVK